METQTASDDALRERLDGERRLVEEAVLFVASSGAPRVTVAGLRMGEAILGAARLLAADAGVLIEPLWVPDDGTVAMLVEAARP